MARSVRIQYAGTVCHVMCRGNRREAIIRDDKDRELFTATLAEMCARTGMVVHGYVLMGNHYHLLLETPEGNLVAGMKAALWSVDDGAGERDYGERRDTGAGGAMEEHATGVVFGQR